MLKHLLSLSVFCLLSWGIASSSQAQGNRPDGGRHQVEWEHLGCVNIGQQAGHDILELSRRDGRFSALSLLAIGNDVEIIDLNVVYGNGRPDDIRVRSLLREGEKTRPLDLEGRKRFIDRIELTSKINRRGGGEGAASICISGLTNNRAYESGFRGEWQELGCAGVAFNRDRDVIPVGRREGRFESIRLRAFGNDIDIDRLRVIYGNGRPDDIQVRSLLREGHATRPLDLQGKGRRIDRVELITQQDPKGVLKDVLKGVIKGKGSIGKARICVDGLETGGFRGGSGR